MVTAVGDPAGKGGRLILCPYAPLSARAAVLIFVLVSIPVLSVAVACGLLGSWQVLPLSLLVIAGVGAGLAAGYRRTHAFEVVSIAGNTVAVEKGHRYLEQHYEFPRGWAQVVLEEAAAALAPSHLFIRSHGRQVEIGAFLDEEERHALAGDLRRLMGPGRSFESLASA